LEQWRQDQGTAALPFHSFKPLFGQLLSANYFLRGHNVVHLDLKLDNILIHNNSLILCDFGCARKFLSNDMIQPFATGGSPGGNIAHLSPEVRTAFATGTTCNYSMQSVWACGVIALEMIFGEEPFPDYLVSMDDYEEDIPSIPADYPEPVRQLIVRMVSSRPDNRPSLAECMSVLDVKTPDQQREAQEADADRETEERIGREIEARVRRETENRIRRETEARVRREMEAELQASRVQIQNLAQQLSPRSGAQWHEGPAECRWFYVDRNRLETLLNEQEAKVRVWRPYAERGDPCG
jgi:serine/threonine protein kinase